jgi:hypothetical protein
MFTSVNCWLLGLRLYWSISKFNLNVEFSIFSLRFANSCYFPTSLFKSEVKAEAVNPDDD